MYPNVFNGHALLPLGEANTNFVEVAGHVSEHKVEIDLALRMQ